MAQTDYKALLASRMERDFSKWRDQGEIQEREVYRFLHTMKGTAGTIGLMELSNFCAARLDEFSEHSNALLPAGSLDDLMASLEAYFGETAAQAMEAAAVQTPSSEKSFVLLIDPDAEFAAQAKEALEQQGIPAVIALDAPKGLELFYTLEPRMVVMELDLPGADGFGLAEKIHEAGKSRHLPVALVSENDALDNRIRAMEIGVTDFLSKPVDLAFFLPYMANRLRSQETLAQGIRRDELTGAGNKASFEEALTQMANLSERNGKPFTLALFDLDQFKKINDVNGHSAGDEALRQFAQLVLAEKRDSDALFRYGGDEFAMILPDTKTEAALAFIERLRSALSKAELTLPSGQPLELDFSCGLKEFRSNPETLTAKAEQALHQAKLQGPGAIKVYKEMETHWRRKLNILIVDDDSLVRRLVSKQFSNWKTEEFDLHIQEFENGLALVESDWYEPKENYMILLDGVMPKMDGLEVLNHIRTRYPSDNIVISMLTSRTNEADVVLALKSGADDYIVKPFYAQEIVARVQRLTKRLFH